MNDTLLHPLNHLGSIHVKGEDGDTFLQGQLCNDVRLLTAEQGQLSAYNSPKGRMLAVLHLTRTGDGIRLEIERSVLDATLKRLRMFVLRSKAVLENVSADDACLGISGGRAEAILAAVALPAPSQTLGCACVHGITIVRRHGATPRFSLHGPVAALDALREKIAAMIPTASDSDWRRHDIVAGVPTVLPATSDHFVPQMANLDVLGGISFTKGCYTGQEIVARMHYLGQLKRRLMWTRTSAHDVEAGAAVYDGDYAQAVGEVAQVAEDDAGLLLGVVMQLSHAESEALHLGGDAAQALTRLQKPLCLEQ